MATDYEKKYKEALERAKRLTSDMTTLQKIREFIFPELVESEDERIRKELMEFVNWAVSRGSVRNDWLLKKCPEKWIAYLEKQKEQKPAEWSEEDEKDMAHIIRILDDCDVYGTHDLSKTDHENLVNKLKSLRPSWKPSEEHLSALLAVFNDPNNIGSQTCQLALTDLYEQLKKL